VRALINHDPNLVLARTKSKTLDLFTDKKGNLAYKFKTPNRSYAKDLEDAVKSGDIDQSSFAFRVAEEKWEWRDDNEDLKKDRRTINRGS
jgi:HK97 family phage prohead protease